jgi:hypothetical protein
MLQKLCSDYVWVLLLTTFVFMDNFVCLYRIFTFCEDCVSIALVVVIPDVVKKELGY